MTVLTFQNQVIEKLVTVELKAAELYQIYAEKFTDYQQFWQDIVKEEKLHAKGLNMLNSLNSEDTELNGAILDRFPLDMIESTINFINNCINEADQPNFTIQQALNTALNIENCIIEENIYEVFHSDNDELKQLFELIVHETWQHADKIECLLKDIS